ncbi:hypothetical protein ACNOYE_29545 [Nannocystaceae bacterium ST9]
MASRVPLLASLVVASGCLGPNPYLDDEASADSESADAVSTDSETTLDTSESESAETNTDSTTGDPSCTNDMLDGNETAVDCGGDCPPCETGDACLDAMDCVSGVCDETCQAPSCDDDVLNGDELEVDCGGEACGFCELSAFIPAWDDFDARDAEYPSVAINDAGEIAIGFTGSGDAYLRWFQELGAPLTSGVYVGEMADFVGDQVVPITLRADADETTALALLAGVDGLSTSCDLFMIEHTLASGEGPTRVVFQGDPYVNQGAIASASSVASLAWKQDKQIQLRRRDFSVANGEWIDLMALQAETDPVQFDGDHPDLAVDSEGMLIVVWSRCAKAGTPCTIALRRFDGNWIDAEPIEVSPPDLFMTSPHVAVDSEGRIALSWSLVDIGDSWAYARILGPDLTPEGEAWVLQMGFPQQVDTDVAALDDGSFAFAWADTEQSRVHLRRFVNNDVPKLMNVSDEAPWPTSSSPASPALANANHRLSVVWSAIDGPFRQIHGQVLAY